MGHQIYYDVCSLIFEYLFHRFFGYLIFFIKINKWTFMFVALDMVNFNLKLMHIKLKTIIILINNLSYCQ